MADEKFLKRWSRDKLTKTRDADSLDSIVEIDEEQAALPDIPESETDAPDDQPPITTLLSGFRACWVNSFGAES